MIAENLTHFSTIADLLATFVDYRTVSEKIFARRKRLKL